MNMADLELPDGWLRASLIEVADVIMGQSPPGSSYNNTGDGLPFFQGKTDFGHDHPTPRKWCSAPTRVAEPGDVLVCVRAPVGPTNVADRKCAIGRGLAIVRPHEGIPTNLIRYAINLQEDEIASWISGTTFTAIKKSHFTDIVVPLPPLELRERITTTLDTMTVRRRSSIFHVLAARRAAERLRQAILVAACIGRLSEDWRERNPDVVSAECALGEHTSIRRRPVSREQAVDLDLPDLPASYIVSTVGDAAMTIEYGTSQRCNAESGVPVLRMGNIQDGALTLSDLKYCALDGEIERLLLQDGDLLFNRTNSPELVGKSAVFHHTDEVMSFASYLIRVRFDENIALSDYVNYWLNSAWGRSWAQLAKTDGVSQSNINGSKLALMPLPIPPLEEQRVIVERASQMLEIADGLVARVENTRNAIAHSSRSVLAKAFRGSLVS